MDDKALYEIDEEHNSVDPDEIPVRDRKLIIQPTDMSIDSLFGQIKGDTIHVRPLSQKPKFQRKYVWSCPSSYEVGHKHQQYRRFVAGELFYFLATLRDLFPA